LDDPPAADGAIRLGEVAARLSVLAVACNRCPRRGRLNLARLIARHGPAKPMPALLRALAADCPRVVAASIYDGCGAHFPELAALFLTPRHG